MFTGYNLKLNEDFFDNELMSFDEYKIIGESHLNSKVFEYKNDLNRYIRKRTINGSELQDDNFPIIDADVFISHSSNDVSLANALAGWIHKEFKLKVFIDSNVWGYSQKLLEDINSDFCNKKKDENYGFTYDHNACNNVSQHVNIMLSVALQKMIDRVECVILLNTDNSIEVFDDINKTMNITYSPWIYSEIVCTQIVRKKPLLYYRKYAEFFHANESVIPEYALIDLKISYNISLIHLTDLDKEDLMKWNENFKCNCYEKYQDYPLDALYCFKHPKELENTKTLFRYFSCDYIEYFKSVVDGNVDSQYVYELFERVFLCEYEKNNCSICKGERCKCIYKQRGLNE